MVNYWISFFFFIFTLHYSLLSSNGIHRDDCGTYLTTPTLFSSSAPWGYIICGPWYVPTHNRGLLGQRSEFICRQFTDSIKFCQTTNLDAKDNYWAMAMRLMCRATFPLGRTRMCTLLGRNSAVPTEVMVEQQYI